MRNVLLLVGVVLAGCDRTDSATRSNQPTNAPIWTDSTAWRLAAEPWSVFDSTGTFLGEVTMPAAFVAETITNDRVLGLFQDSLNVKHARVYRLIKP